MRNLFIVLVVAHLASPLGRANDLVATEESATEAAGQADPAAPLGLAEHPTDFANISGIPQEPNETSAPTTADEVRAAPGGDEAGCKALNPALRAMVFRHFLNFQEMYNAQGQYLPVDKTAEKASLLLGKVPKESSGDTASVTDMSGREYGTYTASTTLDRWRKMFDQKKIVYNKQTNYGLAQQSMDRLVTSFKISSKVDDFLRTGDTTNSGQNVRRVLDIYQHFAQGRLIDKDRPITEKQLKDPNASAELKERAKAGIDSALWHCGTRFLFKEGYQGAEGEKALREAMQSIAYCDSGARRPDVKNVNQMRCFAKWVTLCPALNLDIGLMNPDSYFATRHAAPLCKETFKKLIKKKP